MKYIILLFLIINNNFYSNQNILKIKRQKYLKAFKNNFKSFFQKQQRKHNKELRIKEYVLFSIIVGVSVFIFYKYINKTVEQKTENPAPSLQHPPYYLPCNITS